jgi:hypothetical protein
MTTETRTPAAEITWLRNAARELDARGDWQLAEDARTEAGQIELRLHREAVDRRNAELVARDAAMRCDNCGFKVSEATAREFEDVDWVICRRCQDATSARTQG